MNTAKKNVVENISELFKIMNKISDKKMKSYKSDLEYDFKHMKEHEKDGFFFLWAVRLTGTWMRPFMTNGDCVFKSKKDYKDFMYSVINADDWLDPKQSFYIINVNYHGEYSIKRVSKANVKKAIDTWLDSFEKYRLDIVWNGEVIDSTAPTRAEAERLVKEYKLGFHGGDFDIKAVAI